MCKSNVTDDTLHSLQSFRAIPECHSAVAHIVLANAGQDLRADEGPMVPQVRLPCCLESGVRVSLWLISAILWITILHVYNASGCHDIPIKTQQSETA